MSKRIMVVDDSATVRQILQITLSPAGYEVIEPTDRENALEVFSNHNIDMLVTELNMPNMDGIDLIKQVRQSRDNRFMPIVMLTAESQSGRMKVKMQVFLTCEVPQSLRQGL